MGDIDKGVAQVLGGYATAVLAKDVAAFMRWYDPAVRVFDTWGVWSYDGAEAWQRAVEGWFTSLGNETVKVTYEDVRTIGGGAFAIVSTLVTYTGRSAEGLPLRYMQNRLTWALRTGGHVLRIVHEHTSAPIGFDDGKAILQRPTVG